MTNSCSTASQRTPFIHFNCYYIRCVTILICGIFVYTVHLGGGIWGVLSVPMFNKESGIFYARDEHSFRLLGWNLLGVTVIVAWSVTLAFILFITLRVAKQLRVSEEIELRGEYPSSYWANCQACFSLRASSMRGGATPFPSTVCFIGYRLSSYGFPVYVFRLMFCLAGRVVKISNGLRHD